MAEIRNLTRNGETFYPLTCSDAVLNRDGEPLGLVNDIFDISEYNASGTPPVLAKYASLSLALAAVPTSKQKGGMTIRYVQTSDNTYVQYTLTSNSFNINTENWNKQVNAKEEEITSKNNIKLLATNFGGNTNSSLSAGVNGFWFVESIQKRLRNKKITGIAIEISTIGTLSVLKGTGIGTDDFSKSTVEQFNITKTGVVYLEFSTPLYLNDNEWVGICDGANDTAIFKYLVGSSNLLYEQWFKYKPSSSWQEGGHLCVEFYSHSVFLSEKDLDGIYETLDGFEKKVTDDSVKLVSSYFTGTTPVSLISGVNGYWLEEKYQQKIRGRLITGVCVNIKSPGTFTVLKGTGIRTNDFSKSVIEQFVVNKTGLVTLCFSSPFILASNEWIGFVDGNNDTAIAYFGGSSPYSAKVWYKPSTYWNDVSGFEVEIYSAGFLKNEGLYSSVKKLEGKNIAIVGDSISTYSGYIPSGYVPYYPSQGAGVTNVDQCYWKIVCDRLGLNFNNCSWSGSNVSGNSLATDGNPGCSTKRVTDLSRDGFAPDIIWIYMGINDWRNLVPIGNWTQDSEIPEDGQIDNFSTAYALLLWKCMSMYPNAKIYCSPLMISVDQDVDLHYPGINSAGVSINSYNNKIREIALALGANIIEMPACGINFATTSTFFNDEGLHPNAAGHVKMADQLTAGLIAKY